MGLNLQSKSECPCCNGDHSVARCGKFRSKQTQERLEFAKGHKLCLNCLSSGHFLKKCLQKSACKYCTSSHHSLLHLGSKRYNPAQSSSERVTDDFEVGQGTFPMLQQLSGATSGDEPVSSLAIQTNQPPVTSNVLLSTALARVIDKHGQFHSVRVLIDSGSEANFITRACVKRLGLPVTQCDKSMIGLDNTSLGVAKGTTQCTFEQASDTNLTVEAFVVDKIATCPEIADKTAAWPHLKNLPLADPHFRSHRSIDILLGAEWFTTVMLGDRVEGCQGSPGAMRSIWGFCVMGRTGHAEKNSISSFHVATGDNINDLLRKFWELEEPPSTPELSEEDQQCENSYRLSTTRLNGRYIVELPFRLSPSNLNNSRALALRRFHRLEARLAKSPNLRNSYNAFMSDYLGQKHMEVCSSDVTGGVYYLPHHCIAKELESKFRVVFDASMTTQSGPSLNELLHTGPKLQLDIVDILFQFRMFRFALVCDIRQMYRNIGIAKHHQDYQRIFWRFSPEDELREYKLTTVTYGTSAAPFLAIRTLHQLVHDEGSRFPLASSAILESTYMNDIVRSVSSLQDALKLQSELVNLMKQGQFELRKWVSNNEKILSNIPSEHQAVRTAKLEFDPEVKYTKILGLVWEPERDVFTYHFQPKVGASSKRGILSLIAQLYDPVGFLSPVTFLGKCLIQHLWQLGIDWDDPIPVDILDKWDRMRNELGLLSQLAIKRWLQLDGPREIQIHGFSDSSERGYAGVVYIRVILSCGNIKTYFVLAKSKVAPLKKVTLPRLELCAALLTTKLVCHVEKQLGAMEISSKTVWSDSSVTLSWIRSSPHKWKNFIANRVSQIQSLLPPACFRYVPSAQNSADCASRGLFPSQLLNFAVWWDGPEWLSSPESSWPLWNSLPLVNVDMEQKALNFKVQIEQNEHHILQMILDRYSTLPKVQRLTALCLRFIHNLQNGNQKRTGWLSKGEIADAMNLLLKFIQGREFPEEIGAVRSGKIVPHRLKRLNPFVGKGGLLRVGGRLRHASLSYETKHPILLPKDNSLTNMIIEFYHRLYLHPGVLNLWCILQNEYWVVGGRDTIRRRLLRCIACFKTNPRSVSPKMGDLPIDRVQQVKAFTVTGVDYGGPFPVKLGKLRNAKVFKAYICLFVCFSTRAVHLELASELSTDAFLAAFRRFIARRGLVKKMYSDCGTNFVGAKRTLESWYSLIHSDDHNSILNQEMLNKGIEWHSNPPTGSHFGGLFEAAIKSVKGILYKVIGEQVLTYEEFYTILVQIEGTLNSRPLTPMSGDPNDCQALTPGHFLLQDSPSSLVEPDISDVPTNLLKRWQLLQQIVQSFWKRWQSQYLCSLQQRTKWFKSSANPAVGSLVIVKDDNLPPLRWKLGRVTKLFFGSDGVARVADLKTTSGTLTRPVIKLCPLPME